MGNAVESDGRTASRLTLLTSYYPFGVDPEFLGTEIYALADAFDTVTVVPMIPQEARSWPLPPNVTVDLTLAERLTPRVLCLPEHARRNLRRLLALPTPIALRAMRDQNHLGFGRAWWARLGMDAADFTTIRRWAKSREIPDIAYTFWLGPQTAALADAWPSVPVVTRAHRGDLYAQPEGFDVLPFQEEGLERAALIAVISDDAARYVGEHFPAEFGKVAVHRLGAADPGATAPRSSDGVTRVWSVSSMSPVKRVTLIAAAVTLLAQRLQGPVHWTHLGDGTLRHEVEAVVAQAGPEVAVDLPGMLPHHEVLQRLTRGPADVFVNASSSEGVPVSLMEARSLGIPVVATDVGGAAEVVNIMTDVLVSADADGKALCAAMERAVALPRDLAVTRVSDWRSRYLDTTNYDRWTAVLRSLTYPGRGARTPGG